MNAINDFTSAININSNEYIPYYNRGLSYMMLGNYQRAIEDYTKALQLNPNSADIYINRGISYANINNLMLRSWI